MPQNEPLTLQEITNAKIREYGDKLNGNKTKNENDNKNAIEEKILLQKQSQNEKSNTADQTGLDLYTKLPKNFWRGVDIEDEENDNDNDNDGEWD